MDREKLSLDLALRNGVRKEMSSSSANSTPMMGVRDGTTSPVSALGLDPPRPAKDGMEWVWFPEGYWAEREVRPLELTSKGSKSWRWRSRSGKSPSGAESSPSRGQSPKTVVQLGEPGKPMGLPPHPPPPPKLALPQSPYLSEAQHVQSLQHPNSFQPLASTPLHLASLQHQTYQLLGRITADQHNPGTCDMKAIVAGTRVVSPAPVDTKSTITSVLRSRLGARS